MNPLYLRQTLNWSLNIGALGASKLFPIVQGRRLFRKLALRLMNGKGGLSGKSAQIMGMSGGDFVSPILSKPESNRLQSKALAALNLVEPLWPSWLEATPTIFACGSIAYIFKGVLRDSKKEVAIKVLRPDAAQSTLHDPKLMADLLKMFGGNHKRFDIQAYINWIEIQLARESSFLNESTAAFALSEICSLVPLDILIPLPIEKYCSTNHLCLPWLNFIPFEQNAGELAPEIRSHLHDQLCQFMLFPWLTHGWIHGDSNPGNFGYQVQNGLFSLSVLDFGASFKMNSKGILACRNIMSKRSSANETFDNLVALGFDGETLEPIKEKLNDLLDILLEPFHKPNFQSSGWNRKSRVLSLLADQRWRFMAAAPPHFILFIRSISGLFYYAELLKVAGNYGDILQKALRYSEKVPVSQKSNPLPDQPAQYLRIVVDNEIEQIVSLRLPIDALNRLNDFMDESMLSRLKERGISPNNFVIMSQESNFRIGTHVEYQSGTKKVKLSLE